MHNLRHALTLLPLLLVLSACTASDLLNGLVPRNGYNVIEDMAYGDGPRHKLDLYIPDSPLAGAPTVVFFYGGNWQRGDKGEYLFAAEALASRGYVTAVPDYRLHPEVIYPAFLEDAAAAVDWLRNHSENASTGGKPVYLIGHSAGAYIAAMLTLDARWLEPGGNRICDTVAASVGLAGPYDFLPLQDDTLKIIFGPESQRPQTQPINHVEGTEPPMLLITGSDDDTVSPGNTERLATRINDTGGRVETLVYDDVSHVGVVVALAKPFRGTAPTLADIDRFLRDHPTTPPRPS